MLSIQRGAGSPDDATRARGRRPAAALLASVGVNALLFGAFVAALTRGYRWTDRVPRRAAPAPERIAFVQAPRAQGPSVAGRSGGDGRPLSATPARSRPLVAPRAVPSVLPPITRGAPSTDVGGTGAVVGNGGAGQGIQPEYRDPALWTRPGTLATAPKTAKERVDSVLTQVFGAARDSILAVQEMAAGKRKPGDWTFKGPGGTWGIDDHSIHLGKIAVPNAVLALLSSKFQQNLRGNPVANVEARRLGDIRQDILDHAQRSMNEDDFRGAVKQIRARKDRERNERLAERRRAAELAAEGEQSAAPADASTSHQQ
ncbi:hypothetical protein tb265_29410 [Gemmatimonadetes bacterium T265]|nr:hypothetical protein tb265_29410 [Gemmatimonadetes bacterium T265]